uniref:Uncharacterized protein n=1 Tax=Bactrocera dorsalis TaxID=27457 RepID=A0A034VSX5_BACDO
MSGSLSILIIGHLQLTTICLLIFTFNNLDNVKAFGPRRSAPYTIDEPSKQLRPDDTPEPQENWFEQKLDHFDDKQENITWKQVRKKVTIPSQHLHIKISVYMFNYTLFTCLKTLFEKV